MDPAFIHGCNEQCVVVFGQVPGDAKEHPHPAGTGRTLHDLFPQITCGRARAIFEAGLKRIHSFIVSPGNFLLESAACPTTSRRREVHPVGERELAEVGRRRGRPLHREDRRGAGEASAPDRPRDVVEAAHGRAAVMEQRSSRSASAFACAEDERGSVRGGDLGRRRFRRHRPPAHLGLTPIRDERPRPARARYAAVRPSWPSPRTTASQVAAIRA